MSRKLKATLSVTAVAAATGYIFFSIILGQSYSGVSSVIGGIASGMFFIAFLASCRALKIVNYQRRQLR